MRSLLQYRGYCTFVSLLVLLCANNSQQTPQEEGKNIRIIFVQYCSLFAPHLIQLAAKNV
jgi:hypothetical protein